MDENNFVDLVASVEDEHACKELCNDNKLCAVYTFYDSEDLVQPNACVLLSNSGLQAPDAISSSNRRLAISLF